MQFNKLKKAAAVLLSAAMVCSVLPGAGISQAEASVRAPKYVKLNTAFKTLKTGQKDYRLYLTHNKSSWKVKKVAVSDKSIVAAYGKTSGSVLLKGKKAGRASVTLHLQTAKRKKNNTKKLTCKVRVVSAAVPAIPDITDPNQPADPVTPSAIQAVTAASQTELEKALANDSLKSLSIRTTDTVNLKIPAGNYSKVALVVDAPNAEIENKGVFQSITIHAIKENTWIEEAIGNNLKIEAAKARVVIGEGAKVDWVDLSQMGAEIELEINGAVSSVAVSATMKIKFTGNTPIEVPIIIGANAGGTELTASVPVSVATDADANIILNKGAEGSKVKINLKSLLVKLTNSTGKPVETTNADGIKRTVASTGIATTIAQTTPTSSSGSYQTGSSSGSSGSGSSGSTVKHTLPTFTLKAAYKVETTTKGAIWFDKNDIKVQGCTAPQVTKMQWSGHRGEDKWDLKEEDSAYVIHNYGNLGSDYLEEIMDTGRGAYIFVTVQDQGTEYEGIIPMNFGDIARAGYVKTYEGVMTKKTDIKFSFDAQIISGSAIAAAPDKGWIRLTIPKASVKFEGGQAPQLTGAANYDSESNMQFNLFSEDEDQRWVSEKNGRLAYEEMIKQVQNGIRTDRKFLYMTFRFTDNGKKYTASVSTAYRDFFGDDPEQFGNGSHSYTAVLYETE